MKRTLRTTLLIMILTLSGVFAFAQDFFYTTTPDKADPREATSEYNTNIGKRINNEVVNPQNSIIYKLRKIFGLTGGIYNQSEEKATDYIKMIINVVLGLVAFMCLVLIIYSFYLMFFSGQEEGFTKAKKILQGIAIALAILGVSYFIVSFIFYIYQQNTIVPPGTNAVQLNKPAAQ